VGSALLGLSAGQRIDWPLAGGRSTRLKVLSVVRQPESLGEYHR
jgi:regulator of nucleoside diphosphate kinase